MKKTTSLLFALAVLCAARAEMPNPAFGEKNSQLSAHFGQSLRNHTEQLFLAGVSYSQPNGFFRFPGRRNVEFMAHRGMGGLSKYNQDVIFGFSQDLILPPFYWAHPKPLCKIYAGINLGLYIAPNITDRIGSKFTFGERVFLGYRAIDALTVELYGRHFSNGDLTEANSGQNFIGLSAMWNY